MKIYAPVKDTNGIRASVQFTNGVGETDDPKLIQWFKKHGYKVEDTPTFSPAITSEGEPDFDSMTPIELRDWMKENGYGAEIKNTRNKEKLLEIIRG